MVLEAGGIGPVAEMGRLSLREWLVSSGLLWPKTMVVLLMSMGVGEAES